MRIIGSNRRMFLSERELRTKIECKHIKKGWKRRFELPTFGTTIRRSIQLSYFHHIVSRNESIIICIIGNSCLSSRGDENICPV